MDRWLTGAAMAAAAYAVAAWQGWTEAMLVAKPLPAAILALGVAMRAGGGPARWPIAAALGTSAIADLAIEGSFLAGLGLFLLAHVLYAAGFTRDAPRLRPWRGVPFLVVWIAVALPFATVADDLAAPVAIYGLVICVMGWRAAARVRSDAVETQIGFVGVGLFIVSDSLIAIDRFVVDLPWRSLWVLGTYWPAQASIAWSALDDARS